MGYKKYITEAKAKGVTTEKAMWAGIDRVDAMLETMKEEHPDLYAKFMKETHEDLYGCHYTEKFAEHDLENIQYTDKNGVHHKGPYWTKDQVAQATADQIFPSGTTDCDKWVAYNTTYADLNQVLTDAQILEVAHTFWFDDEDAPTGKIWKYMRAMHE